MKMKTIENIRKAEIIGALSFSILSKLANSNDPSFALLTDNINFITLGNLITNYGYTLDILTNMQTIKLTEEYKYLDNIYHEFLGEVSNLLFELEINDPESICAIYEYMYRKGYLSRNKTFKYSTDMKDIPNLYGLDVVRGAGVCRSIASLLVDIYRYQGYESHGLAVRVQDGLLKETTPELKIDLMADENARKFVNVAIILGKTTGIANHEIVEVTTSKGGLLLCPTNCLVLQKEGLKITVANQPTTKKMVYNPVCDMINSVKTNPHTSLKEITTTYNPPDEEYREKFDGTIKKCRDNEDVLEAFYQQNSELYSEIGAVSDKQRGLVKRLIPIIPNKK